MPLPYKIKFLITLLFILCINCSKADFIHPMDFDEITQKDRIIQIIKDRTRDDYCNKLNMCQETILRMMERENLEAFKRATKAQNRKIMNQVIKDYCRSGLDMCNYATIWMMYEENLNASQESLSW